MGYPSPPSQGFAHGHPPPPSQGPTQSDFDARAVVYNKMVEFGNKMEINRLKMEINRLLQARKVQAYTEDTVEVSFFNFFASLYLTIF